MTEPTYTQTTSPLHHLPAGHPAWGLIRECMEIACGTLGVLIESSSYAEIAAVRANWLDFLALAPETTAGLASWMEAWWLFWDSTHGVDAEIRGQ